MIATNRVQEVKISRLVMSDDVQMRDSISHVAVQDYADAMEDGSVFPPVVAFESDGKMWLADGWHRVLAAKKIGRKTINCELRPGTRRDAILHAAAANATHGVRRTNADKQRTVTALLKDREWSKWTDTEIARRAIVSHSMVARYRELLGKTREYRVYVDTSGKMRSRTVESFKHKPSSPEKVPEPDQKIGDRTVKCPHCGKWLRIN